MFADCSCSESIYQVPKLNVAVASEHDLYARLKGFQEHFNSCFFRSESRDKFFKYLSGQLSLTRRKSIETMAREIEGASIRGLQRFISDSFWEEEEMLHIYHELVNEDFGHRKGALIFEETGFLKKGKDSAGVARQKYGHAVKLENCQVGVFCAYASPYGYSLLDKRLYMPEEWFSKDFEKKRRKCNVPDKLCYRSKPEMATEMFSWILEKNILPFSYVVLNNSSLNSNNLIHTLTESEQLNCFLAVPDDFCCWSDGSGSGLKGGQKNSGSRKGGNRAEPQLVRLDSLASRINPYYWYHFAASVGGNRTDVFELARSRVALDENGIPGRSVWLVIKRKPAEDPGYFYYLCDADQNVSLRTLAWLSGLPWAIDQCFTEARSLVGLDHYEVRKFRGWHHHILTCMLARFFLGHMQIASGIKSRDHYRLE